jgi:hypothetical protein
MNDLEPIRDARDQSIICGWHDKGGKCDFRRIWGAVAWPNQVFDRPGFALVVAEHCDDRGPRRVLTQDEVSMHVLAEAENSNFNELMSKCVEFDRVVTSWFCGPADLSVAGLLQRFNQRQRAAGRPLFPFPSVAPLITSEGNLEEAFKFGIAAIKDRGKKGTLNIKDCPLLNRCLSNIQPGDSAKLEDFPAFAALCFAVVALDRIPYVHPVANDKPAFALTEYDPLQIVSRDAAKQGSEW